MAGPPEFDIETPAFRVEPTPRWIRVRAGGEWIADSREALLLSWTGSLTRCKIRQNGGL